MIAKHLNSHLPTSVGSYSSQRPSAALPTRKRTHLKPSQLAVLQASFQNNPLPDASIRHKLAQELGVSERTVQIWFQNRRAKARKLEAISKSLSTTCSAEGTSDINNNNSVIVSTLLPNLTDTRQPPAHRYQPTFRTMMTPERFEELRQQQEDTPQPRRRPRSSSKPEPRNPQILQAAALPRAMSEGTERMVVPEEPINAARQGDGLVSLSVQMLRIGTWTRFAQTPGGCGNWDLDCNVDTIKRQFVWQIKADGHYFEVRVPFDAVLQLRLSQQIQAETGQPIGQLEVELLDNAAANMLAFVMKRSGIDQDWVRCGDFSEDRQASLVHVHVLEGPYEALEQALLTTSSSSPELANKVVVMSAPSPVPVDLCRDLTLSPSVTPEPYAWLPVTQPPIAYYPQQTYNNNKEPWLVDQMVDPTGYYALAGGLSQAADPSMLFPSADYYYGYENIIL